MSSLYKESLVSEKSEDGYDTPTLHERGKNDSFILPKDEDAIEKTYSHDDHHSLAPSQAPYSGLKKTASNVLTRVASRLTTTSIVNPPPPPDGGLKAWTQVAMAWLVVFNTWGYVNSFGAFQTYYTSTLSVSPSTISWIGSVQVWILFFLGAFSGRALDAGLFLPTFLIGIVIQLIGIFMMSLSTKYWQIFLTQGVCTGIGGGIFFTPSMALVSTYFSAHRGIAIGIVSTGNSAGGMIYPVIVRQLLPKIGFAWTVRVLGFVQLACLGIVLAFMRPRLPPRKSGPVIEWVAFKEPVYALFISGMFFITGPLYFTFYYLASFARDTLQLSYPSSVNLLIILNGIGIPARLLPGYIADRHLGVLNTFTPLLYLNALLLYTWLAATSQPGFYAFTCFYGLASGAFQSLFPTAIASITPDLAKMGSRLGMAFFVMAFAGLTGPPLGGALLTTDSGGYMPAQVWVATSTLLGAGFCTAARIKNNGWSWKVKC